MYVCPSVRLSANASYASVAVCTHTQSTPRDNRYLTTADGRHYYPCGFRAQSMFTDHFRLVNRDLHMNTSALSWATDAKTVYHNPGCFPNCTEKYVWLGEAYAGTPYEEQLRRDGLDNQHFQTWMRVSAFSRFAFSVHPEP